MRDPGEGLGLESARRRRAHRRTMGWGLLASALVHGLALFGGRLEVPGGPPAPVETPAAADGALRVVHLAPLPSAPAAAPPPSGPGDEAITSGEDAGARAQAAPAQAPAPDVGPAELRDLGVVAPGPLPSTSTLPAPGPPVVTFDLRPMARAAAPPARSVEVAVKRPGLLRRVLGGIVEGLSVAIRVPCGADGVPGEPVPGGAPVVPDGSGMPGLPGVRGGLPTGPDAVGMPEPEVIGMPAVPDPTFGGTEGPIAGVDGRAALGDLIGCDDGRGRGGAGGAGWPGVGGPGRAGGGPGGIFRPGGLRRVGR